MFFFIRKRHSRFFLYPTKQFIKFKSEFSIIYFSLSIEWFFFVVFQFVRVWLTDSFKIKMGVSFESYHASTKEHQSFQF
jgi:hypothetical protein